MSLGMRLRHPTPQDGAAIHDLALRAGGLDVNSRYAYVLWCRDFSRTSVLADPLESGSVGPVGFVIGYRRPDRPDTLFVWQVGVAPTHRGRGLGTDMVCWLFDRHRHDGGSHLEATVTPDNAPSRAMFGSFAHRFGLPLCEEPLFSGAQLGDAHDDEHLVRIGPIASSG